MKWNEIKMRDLVEEVRIKAASFREIESEHRAESIAIELWREEERKKWKHSKSKWTKEKKFGEREDRGESEREREGTNTPKIV